MLQVCKIVSNSNIIFTVADLKPLCFVRSGKNTTNCQTVKTSNKAIGSHHHSLTRLNRKHKYAIWETLLLFLKKHAVTTNLLTDVMLTLH